MHREEAHELLHDVRLSRKTSANRWLGYLDSNQEHENQNLPCCQLHHTPPVPTEAGPTVYFSVLPRSGGPFRGQLDMSSPAPGPGASCVLKMS